MPFYKEIYLRDIEMSFTYLGILSFPMKENETEGENVLVRSLFNIIRKIKIHLQTC